MVLVEYAYVPPGLLVRSAGRGLFVVGVVVGVCAGALCDVGRVLCAGIYVGMGAACIVLLHMSRNARLLVAARDGGGVCTVC